MTGSKIGFISVVDLGNDVVIGGYLIVNELGRPLEFHCTEPVRPNRAQQILYGASLRSFMCGDRIGMSLVQHATTRPALLCTDLAEVASMRPTIDTPLVLAAEEALPNMTRVQLGAHEVFVDDRFPDDATSCRAIMDAVSPGWNIAEPFERIREAVSEIQKAA